MDLNLKFWMCMFVVLSVYFAQSALQVNFIHASHFQVLHATTRIHEHEMTGNFVQSTLVVGYVVYSVYFYSP